MAAALIWGLYSLLIMLFPVFSRSCFRLGRQLPGRSLLNGGALFAVSLALLFVLLFMLRATSGVGIGLIFILFQLAGLAVGLVALGGRLGFIDTEKKPYSALALGMALLWIVRIFSIQASNTLCLLIGIYGVGAVILHFRGNAGEAPREGAPPAAAGQAPPAPGGPVEGPSSVMPGQPKPAPGPEPKPGEPEKKPPTD
ncbi:MAG: hypothetical protein KKH28_07610 [Elusimicrobia bacterium]|nr:hypothetical protein [Elusimicrobiota bacterium]